MWGIWNSFTESCVLWIFIDNRYNSTLLKIPPTGCHMSFWKAIINLSCLFSYELWAELWAARYFSLCDLTNSICSDFNRWWLLTHIAVIILHECKFSDIPAYDSPFDMCCTDMFSHVLPISAYIQRRWLVTFHIRWMLKHINNLRKILAGTETQHSKSV